MIEPSKKTPLYKEHIELGGKIAKFAGWCMPLWYSTGQTVEHITTRSACGLFDICHMGEFRIIGSGSHAFLSNLLTNHVDKMNDNQAMYQFLLNEQGGVIDDCILYRFDINHWMLVVNAGNIKTDMEWLEAHKPSNINLQNVSDQTIKIDLQGPKAPQLLAKWINREELINLRFFRFIPDVQIEGMSVLVSRTGYTGEIGFELYTDIKHGIDLWNLLLFEGKQLKILPCGLGARDTLRTEAGLPLHGHELSLKRPAIGHPWEFAVDWGKEFLGKPALLKYQKEGIRYFVLPFIMNGRRKAMPGWEVRYQDEVIGVVLSGVISPTLNNVPIGFLGSHQQLALNTPLSFRQRERQEDLFGEVTSIPFVEVTSRKKMSQFL